MPTLVAIQESALRMLTTVQSASLQGLSRLGLCVAAVRHGLQVTLRYLSHSRPRSHLINITHYIRLDEQKGASCNYFY